MGDDINWGQGSGSYSTILAALQNIVTALNAQTQAVKANTIVYPVTVGLGGTGVAVRGATFQSLPAAPTGTSSLVAVMMGLAGSITPKTTGTVLILISGTCYNNTNADGVTVQIRYGTGAAPVNGVALTGTAASANQGQSEPTANFPKGFSLNGLVTGLTVGTTYWIDLAAAAVTGGTCAIGNLTINAIEVTV